MPLLFWLHLLGRLVLDWIHVRHLGSLLDIWIS